MTEEEKKNKQNSVKQTWANDNRPTDWIFDEAICAFVPPKSMPADGKDYIWVQEANNWVEVIPPQLPENNRPPYPTDGKLYDYDESTNEWIPMLT